MASALAVHRKECERCCMHIRLRYFAVALLWAHSSWGADNQAEEIVRRSVANTNADWAAAPQYDFTERDVITKGGKRSVNTYEVLMIDGSPYNRVIAVNDRPLSSQQAAEENRKLEQEIQRRSNESRAARRKRVAEYQKERRQNHALMNQMAKAFNFSLVGEDTVNGRRCFVLNATPKPGYNPPNRDTEVLTGMRGKMWIDTQQYQWVKVRAQVFRPVSFGLFFASVKPGTEFTLEQKPVEGSLWLPSHFYMAVNARVLFWSRHSSDDESYWSYHRASEPEAGRRSGRRHLHAAGRYASRRARNNVKRTSLQ
jgi:hypothetical protein